MKKSFAANIFSKITSVYIAALLSVFLLHVGTGGYQDIVRAKYTAFLIICGGYVLTVIVVSLQLRVIGRLKFLSVKELFKSSSWTQRFICLYLLLTIFSTLLSPNAGSAVVGMTRYEGLLTILIYGLAFLFVSVFAVPKKWMLYLFGAGMCLFSVIALIQLFGLNPLSLYPKGYSYYDGNTAYSGEYIGTIGNADLAAALLCLAIPAFFAALIRFREKSKYLLLLPLGLALTVLFRIKVDSGLVGVFIGGACALPLVPRLSKRRRASAFLILGLALLTGLAALYFIDPPVVFLHQAHEILRGRIDDSFGSHRIYIWRNVLKLVPDRPLFGYGPDTMIASGIEPMSRYSERFGMLYSYVDAAHNEYLNILYCQGAPALLCYLAALGTSLWRWIRRGGGNAAALCGAALLCYSVQAFFGLSMCLTAPFMWLAWAVLENNSAKGGRGYDCVSVTAAGKSNKIHRKEAQ